METMIDKELEERPKILCPERGDSEYTKGYKDGVWQQMLVQKAMGRAMKPTCFPHFYEPYLHNARCLRCGEQVLDENGVLCEGSK